MAGFNKEMTARDEPFVGNEDANFILSLASRLN